MKQIPRGEDTDLPRNDHVPFLPSSLNSDCHARPSLPTIPGSKLKWRLQIFILLPMFVQGFSKRLLPGCVKLGEKVAFCLPTAGTRTLFFHPIFTQPGKHSLEVPCTHMHYIYTYTFNKHLILNKVYKSTVESTFNRFCGMWFWSPISSSCSSSESEQWLGLRSPNTSMTPYFIHLIRHAVPLKYLIQ